MSSRDDYLNRFFQLLDEEGKLNPNVGYHIDDLSPQSGDVAKEVFGLNESADRMAAIDSFSKLLNNELANAAGGHADSIKILQGLVREAENIGPTFPERFEENLGEAPQRIKLPGDEFVEKIFRGVGNRFGDRIVDATQQDSVEGVLRALARPDSPGSFERGMQELFGFTLTEDGSSEQYQPLEPTGAGQGAELGMQMMAEQQAIDEATKAKEMQEVEALLGVLSEQSSPSTEVFAASGSSSSLPANTKGSFSKTSSIGDKANLKSMMDLGIPEKEAGAMLKQGLTPIEAVALYKEYRTESEDKKMQTLLASLAKGEGREGIAQLLFALFSGAIKPEEMNASLRASFLKDLENK